VHGRVCYYNRFSGLLVHRQKTAEAVEVPLGVVNTQLKQGVNERLINAKHKRTPLVLEKCAR